MANFLLVYHGAVGTAATGYSILKAESLSQSVELAKACPVLKSGGKNLGLRNHAGDVARAGRGGAGKGSAHPPGTSSERGFLPW
jgi:hypothetical protein